MTMSSTSTSSSSSDSMTLPAEPPKISGAGEGGSNRPRRAPDFQSKVLCLHYFSDALSFQFGEHEEVYRMDQIKEWAELDPVYLDTLRERLIAIAGSLNF